MPSAAPEITAPALYARPKYRRTDGPLVAELCELAGFAPDAEQRLLLNDTFAVGKGGRSAAFEVGVVAPRQNLKTGFLKQAALGFLFITDQRLIVWSAHEFDTAQEALRDMDELCASHPALSRRVKTVHRANGDEAIELHSGARLRFKARTKVGGRGLSGDRVILDEAFALRPEHMGALLPTLSAHPDPQVLYASSAGMAHSIVLHELRKRGRAGAEHLAYAEWGDDKPVACAADECDHHWTRDGCCFDDEGRWRAANTSLTSTRPAGAKKLTIEYIRNERRTLPAQEFARERLGHWDEPAAAEQVISLEQWQALADPDAGPLGDLVLGVDVAPGMAAASIVAVGTNQTGELIDRRPGTGWLASRLTQLVTDHRPAAVVYDPAGPIRSVVPELLEADIELTPIEAKDAISACGALIKAVAEGQLAHRGEAEFDAAITGARLRAVGDGQKWSRKDSTVDITPLVALTIAWWHAMNDDPDYDLLSSFG